jgi:hypothetical protein
MNETEWMACTNPWQIYAEDGFDQLQVTSPAAHAGLREWPRVRAVAAHDQRSMPRI